MRTTDYIFLALAGIAVTIYRLLNDQMEKIIPKEIARETILSLIISVLVVPGAMEYWQLSLTIGIGLASLINMFVKVILKKLEKKVIDKIENL
jgi:hypothetical protein